MPPSDFLMTYQRGHKTYFSWSLGEESECDLCGWNIEEADLDLDWKEDGSGVWYFSYRTGCYDGAGVSSQDNEPIRKLKAIFIDLRHFEHWDESWERQIFTLIKAASHLQ